MILFSPIGATDPIRDFFDGPMLHIVRHYRERGLWKVMLFYTKEMSQTAREFDPYKRVIKEVAPEMEIEEIFTDIDQPHLFDAYIDEFPKIISQLHEQFPKEKILLNISSGTPQMQSSLAIISVEYPYTLAVQVDTPQKKSNRKVPHTSTKEDFEIQLEYMEDSKPDAVNRCREPRLRTIRKYGDKGQILSLIKSYEYAAAFKVAEKSDDIPAVVKKLLKHGEYRMKIQPKEACEIITTYNGEELCPLDGTQRTLMEYYLTIDADQKRDALFDVLIKAIPFLFELLLDVVIHDDKLRVEQSCIRKEKNFFLQRDLLNANNPELLAFLDEEYSTFRNNTPLSSMNLTAIVNFAVDNTADTDKRDFYRKLSDILDQLTRRKLYLLRNDVAHTITDVDEEKFKQMVGLDSAELVKGFFELMLLVYGKETRDQRGFYDRLNRWIKAALEK